MRKPLHVLIFFVVNAAVLSFACGVSDTECARQKRHVCENGGWKVPVISRLPKTYSKTDASFRMVPTTAIDPTVPTIMTYFPRKDMKVVLPFECFRSASGSRALNLISIDRFERRGKVYAFVIVVVPDQQKDVMCSPSERRWVLLDEDGNGRFEVAEQGTFGVFPRVPEWVEHSN